MPQHPCMIPQISAPFPCKQLLTLFFDERVLRWYPRPTNWATCSWAPFNSRLLPEFPTGQTATSFGRCSPPGQTKHVVATQRSKHDVVCIKIGHFRWIFNGNYTSYKYSHRVVAESPSTCWKEDQIQIFSWLVRKEKNNVRQLSKYL